MRSLILAAFAGLVLVSCGDDKPEGTELKTNKDKLSYAVGADHAAQLLQDPNFGNYDKEKIAEGFAIGIQNEEAFDMACRQLLQSMLGPSGQQFNAAFKAEGSVCIGKAMGSFFRSGWKQANFISRFDLKMVEFGFKSALNSADTLIPVSERDKMITALIGELNEKVFAEATKGEVVFFNKVKQIPGIKEIGNGIYLETIAEGKGGSPAVGDDVVAHYILMSPNGDTLQSSFDAGQPVPFSLNQVVQGWAIAFPQLKKGGKYRLYVPQGLGYGGNPPQGSNIDRFSPLVFYIELVNYGKPGTLVKPQMGI